MAKPGVRQIFRLRAAARTSSGGRSALGEGLLPLDAAALAGLRYVQDGAPGLRRIRAGRGFRFVDSRGRPLADRAQLDRISGSRSRRPGATSGSRPRHTATSRPRAATRAAASSTATTRAGARCATRRSTTPDGRVRARAAGASARASTRDLRARRPAAREGARHGRAAARGDADPRRQRGVRARRTARSASRRCATRHAAVAGSRMRVPLPRQERQATTWSICATARLGPHRQALPGAAGPGSCSSTSTTSGRRRTIESADVNAYLREVTRRGLHRQGLPHLGGHGARRLGAATSSRRRPRQARRQAQRRARDRERRRAARQHAGGLPQVLRAPGGGRRLPRRLAARGPAARPAAARGLPPDEAGVLALVASRLPASVTPPRPGSAP